MPEDSMIGRYLAARAKAEANNDISLVRECDWNLDRLGYRPGAAPAVIAAAEATADAEARPARRPYTRRTLPDITEAE